MAPSQVPHQFPWRDAHSFLLSPLMGFLSRAWSRLRGPGPPKPWLVEAVMSADQGEAGPEGEMKAALATYYPPWGGHPRGEPGDSGTAMEDGQSSWGTCPDLKANSSLPEAWGLSDKNDDEQGGKEAASIPMLLFGGQSAPWSPSLPRILPDAPGEKGSEDAGVAEDKAIMFFTVPPSHWECCPGLEGEGGEAVNQVPRTPASPSSPGSRPRAWVYCSGEEEAQAKEEERTEKKETRKTSTSPSSVGSHPGVWECYSGQGPEEAHGGADPEPHASVLGPRPLLGTWQHQPNKIPVEDEEEEGEDSVSVEAEGPSATTSTSAFIKAWVCLPGEDTEDSDEDSDWGTAGEEGEAEGPSAIPPTNPFLRAWVHQPGEDSEEDSDDSGTAGEEGEAEGPSAIPPTSAFLRAWVHQPGEDSEEDSDDSGTAGEEGEAEGPSAIPPTSAFLRAWVHQPGEDSEEDSDDSGTAGEEGEAEGPFSFSPTSAFLRSWVHRPGEDSEEDSDDSGTAGEEGEAEGPSAIPPTNAFLRAWVHRPGEDSEEEEEEDSDDWGTAGSGASSSLWAQSAFRGWTYPPGKETEGGDAAEEWGEAEPFRVAIYLPGEKPPLPWALPRLPLRLQRRLKSAETPTQHLDPETPQKARKVRFSEKVSIHFLVVWAGPAQAARRGPWEQFARDRSRFARRIAQAQEKLGPCLTPAARARAWARLGNPPPASLAAPAATTQTLPTSSVQAMPLSHAVAAPSPLYVSVSPCLDLSGRRG